MAKTNEPKTFTDFADAMKAYAMGGYDGIGYRVSEGIGAIDIDHCIKCFFSVTTALNARNDMMHSSQPGEGSRNG